MKAISINQNLNLVTFENAYHSQLTIRNEKIVQSMGFFEPSEFKTAIRMYYAILNFYKNKPSKYSGDATPQELEKEKQQSLF